MTKLNLSRHDEMKMSRRKKNFHLIRFSSLLLFCCSMFLFAEKPYSYAVADIQQQISVTGTVNDSNGEPLPGVTIMIKGSQQGTATDNNGAFTLSVPNANAVLVFSFIGFTTQEITVGTQRIINVKLQEDSQLIEEVVVIGYGTVRKADLTGSVASVSERQFQDQPVIRLEDALQGRMAGVDVVYTSGAIGSDPRVRVRGTSSINRSNDPLYVVDGVIGRNIPNPSDIQSIQVLKDASSTAIYGSRAANGVVLVTTKRGAEGASKITFEATTGFSQIAKKYDLLNAYEYALALKDIWNTDISDSDLEAYRTGEMGVDWYDLMTQTGIRQDYKLGISGGNAKTRYFISANVMDQTGISITSKFSRYSFRSNFDTEVTKWFKFSTNIVASRTYSHNTSINWTDLVSYSPTMTMPMTTIDPATGLEVYLRDPHNSIADNVYGERILNFNDNYGYSLNGNVNMLFNLMEGLTLSVTGAYGYGHSPANAYTSARVRSGVLSGMSQSGNFSTSWQNTNILTYDKKFGDHQITATGVWEMSASENKNISISGTNLANPEVVYYWNYNNAATRTGSNGYSAASVASGVFRLMYNYKYRYLLTASIRADGSSRFQGDNKWGYFPSASIAWDIAKEDFFSDQELFQQMKIRASYGVTGNADIGAYSTLGMLSEASHRWGTASTYTGYWGNNFATPNLRWEKNVQTDIGLDFTMLDGKIGIVIDWFKKDATDLLFQKQVPRYNGGNNFWINQGHVMNTGFEVAVNTTPVKKRNFTWDTNLNATFVKNEIIDLAGEDFIYVDNNSNFGGPTQIHKPGYPIGSFYLYDQVGFDDQGRHLYRSADGALVNIPAADDSFIMGQGNPKWTWGWNNMFRWKNWTANIFFNAATGFQRLNFSRWITSEFHGQYRFVTLRDAYFKGWDNVENKKDAKYPSLKNIAGSYQVGKSSFWLEDADFLKIRNATIAYNIPKSVLKYVGVQLSFSVQNIYTLTKYQGMDPEVYTAGQGVDRGSYPNPRTFTFGLKLDY